MAARSVVSILLAGAATALLSVDALAGDHPRPPPRPAAAAHAAPAAGSFCETAAGTANELRNAAQLKQLNELNEKVGARIDELKKLEASVRGWIDERKKMMSAASDDVVAIYGKLQPEAAASQIAAMSDDMAVSILGKLKPRVASAIMGEMDPARASKLVTMLSGQAAAEDKKS